MKIRIKESYAGPIPKDVLYEAVVAGDGYGISVNESLWGIRKESAEEVDEFEEEFKSKCHLISKDEIGYLGGYLLSQGGWVFLNGLDRLVYKEDIPSLILALLKLMDE